MDNIFTRVPYQQTGYFSKLVTDYISDDHCIQPFYSLRPTAEGLSQAIDERCRYPVNRQALVDVLTRQYEPLTKYPKTEENIQKLLQGNTFTICTAHQPNLLTGYLYFIYKILHAIKMADELNNSHPDKHFVPVYYIGSEDNDLEELGTFRFRGDKYVWDGNGQDGAVGRMDTGSLRPMLDKLLKEFGPPGANYNALKEMIVNAYLPGGKNGSTTVGKATQYLVNELFGRFGLVILNPDEAELKTAFIPVMEDELLHQHANAVITKQIDKLSEHYKIQAHPREINLFYLTDQTRERIEKQKNEWVVLNTKLKFTEEEIIAELKAHPERFSPNVMLRGLYQETILPNVAFIGGGSEVAYWLQLKTLFEYYGVFYPTIHVRQSVMWVRKAQSQLIKQLGLCMCEIFKPEQQLMREYVTKHTTNEWHTDDEGKAIEKILTSLQRKATMVDVTLEAAAANALAKMKHQLQVIEKKMLRAEKKKMAVQMDRIERLKKALFPNNSLQERVENFMEYYLEYGPSFFDTILAGIAPVGMQFLLIEH